MKNGVTWDASDLFKGLAKWELDTKLKTTAYAEKCAADLEARAKRSAKWHDITGEARASIKATVEWRGDKLIIKLTGSAKHFQYLEYSDGKKKKYGILHKTVRSKARPIYRGLSRILKR